MNTEIEAKFLNLDFNEVRDRLKNAGAKLEHPERLMRRVVLDYPDRRLQGTKDSWIRIRDEGDKVTLTFKQTQERQFGGTQEIEVIVSSYEKTKAIFLAIGMEITSDQETKRETWQLDDVEVVLDEWPWLNTFIEIEGPTEKSVQAAASKLGYKWKDAIFGSVTTAYRQQYPKITKDEHISEIAEIKFSLPVPKWFTQGGKN